jgi:hypothetical protein
MMKHSKSTIYQSIALSVIFFFAILPTTNAAITDTAPDVGIAFPTNNQQYIVGNEVTLMGLAGDREDGVLTDYILWSSSVEGFLGTGYQLKLTNLSVGVHTITANITDSTGNKNSHSKTIYIFGAHAGNCPPIINIGTPAANNSVFKLGSPISLGATAADAEQGIINSLVQWTSNISGTIGSGSFLITKTLPVGTHTVTASATDDEGLTTNSTITVIVTTDGKLPNIATSATATASSTFIVTSTDNMVDGNASSSWYSLNDFSTNYVQFRWNEASAGFGATSDNPKFYNIASIALEWAGEYYAGQVDVWTHTKDSWVKAVSDINVSDSNSLNIPVSGEVDSIVISLKNGNMGNYFGISEVQVFGNAAN